MCVCVCKMCFVQRRGMSDAASRDGSVLSQFLRELCDSTAVKRPVTLLARRYRTLIGRQGRKYYDISSLRLAGKTRTLVNGSTYYSINSFVLGS